MIEDKEQYLQRRHRGDEDKSKDHFKTTRQWLNAIFMAGAVVGVAFYLIGPHQSLGIIIILGAMVFKIIECALRFIH